MKISVVMAYHNRRHLLFNTLNSISKFIWNSDVEFVIVDDGSDEAHRIDNFPEYFNNLNIKLIRVKNKWWRNPCIPLNIGFKEASGDVIIIQNPECMHTGNVIGFVEINIQKNDYMVFGCYAVDSHKTVAISGTPINFPNYFDKIKDILEPMANMPCGQAPTANKWYQHSKYRPDALNFCVAMTREDLDDLGGFDERFGLGIAKDDKEFGLRITRKGMRIVNIDEPYVIHQWHPPVHYRKDLVALNTVFWEEWKKREDYKVENKFDGVEYVILSD